MRIDGDGSEDETPGGGQHQRWQLPCDDADQQPRPQEQRAPPDIRAGRAGLLRNSSGAKKSFQLQMNAKMAEVMNAGRASGSTMCQ
jgi:hypothetical protein